MRVVRKILSGILTILLIILIFGFTSSFFVYELVSNQFINQTIKEELSSNIADDLEMEEATLKKVLDNEKVDAFLNKYIDLTLNSLAEDKELEKIELGEELIQFIQENEKQLEKEFNIDIPTEKLKEIMESEQYQQVNEEYKKTIKEAKEELPEDSKQILQTYHQITSSKFKFITLGIIVLTLLLIALLQGSVYKWVFSLGIASLLAGIINAIFAVLSGIIVEYILSDIGMNLSISSLPMLIGSAIVFIVGILLLITYGIISHYKNKEKEQVVSS